MIRVKDGSQYDAQQNIRIDSNPILVFLCIAFLCLVTKYHEFINMIALHKLNATQRMCPCVIL